MEARIVSKAFSRLASVLRLTHGLRFSTRPCDLSPSFNFDILSDSSFAESMRINIQQRNSPVNFDELMDTYSCYCRGEIELRSKLETLFLSLPNFSHPKTPIGDPSKFTVLHMEGRAKTLNFEPKDEVHLLSNEQLPATVLAVPTGEVKLQKRKRLRGLGQLRCHGIAAGSGPRSYYFFGPLAELEQALVNCALDRLIGAGFQQVTVPDILPAHLIESCGFATSGERTQIFAVDREAARPERYCLSGTAEMALAGFCADREFESSRPLPAELFCAASRCYRHEISNQESLLYRTHQFTKVEMFCVAEPSTEAGDAVFEEIVALQKSIFADLGLHFRVLEMPTSELGNSAHRKVDIEAFMPAEGIFGEISSASNCTNYQASRLNMRWRYSGLEPSPFAYTLNGTGCAVTRTMKALIETHQKNNGTVELPEILWPYMNGLRKLEFEDSPLIFR